MDEIQKMKNIILKQILPKQTIKVYFYSEKTYKQMISGFSKMKQLLLDIKNGIKKPQKFIVGLTSSNIYSFKDIYKLPRLL